MSDSGKWNTDLMPRVLIVVVCAAVVVGAVLWLLPAHRFGATPAQNASSTTTGQGSWAATPSAPASGSVGATGGAGAIGGAGGSGASGGAPAGGSTTRSTPRAKPPSADVLARLKPGEWQLYGAQVVSAGTPLTTSGRLDVTGIEIDCEAATKVSGGYGHASVQLSFSASGPTSGKGPWSLFGQFTMQPDGATTDKRQYSGGVQGAVSGKGSGPLRSARGEVTAGFTPIGAYSPGGKTIKSGSFVGDSLFQGVLSLPSVPAPPASTL